MFYVHSISNIPNAYSVIKKRKLIKINKLLEQV